MHESRWMSAVDSDRHTVEGVAHSMAGAAAQLGAQRLAAASRTLEENAKLVGPKPTPAPAPAAVAAGAAGAAAAGGSGAGGSGTEGRDAALLEQAERSLAELEAAADELVALCDAAPSLESLFASKALE